jgi:hypothetical protein
LRGVFLTTSTRACQLSNSSAVSPSAKLVLLSTRPPSDSGTSSRLAGLIKGPLMKLLLLPNHPAGFPAAAADAAAAAVCTMVPLLLLVLLGGLTDSGARSSSGWCAKKQTLRLQPEPSLHIWVLYLHTAGSQACHWLASLYKNKH